MLKGIAVAITAAQLDVKLSLQGKDAVQRGLRDVGDATDATAKKGNILSQAFATGMGFVGAQVFMRATDAVVDFGRAIVDTGLSFEAQMSAVRAVTGATGAELQSLTDLALQIGKDTQFGASEAAIALEELAKAGMSVDAILNGAANSTAMLAAAGGVDMPSAAMVMAAAMNQFGIAAEDSMRVADLLAAASAVSATGVLELGESLKYVGVQANAMGYDIETITTALAIMADQGLVGSQAGTSLNQALLSLANPTAKAKTLMGQLGLSFTDLNGNMLPLPDIIAQLNTSLEGYGDAQRVAYLETLFGVEGGRAMNALLVSQTDAAIEAGKGWDSYYAAVTESGIASEQAAARMDNTMGSIEEFKGALETLAIMASMMILPAFRGVVDAGAELAEGAISWLSDIQRFMSPEGGLGAMEAVLLSTQIALSKVFGGAAATRIMKPIREIVKHLGTAQRVLRSIGGLISGAFGKALDILVDNLDLVAGALKGIAVAAAVFLGWTAFTAIIGGLAAALGLLLSPIGLLIAAAAGLGIAWERNLFGIQDALEPVIDLLDTFGSMIRAVVMYGDDYTDWLRFFPGWAQPVATAIGEIIEGFQGLTDAFQAGGWRGAISELGTIAASLGSWTITVAAPAIISAGWDIASAILAWLGDVTVSLTEWVAQLDGAEIAAGSLDLAGEIASWVSANPVEATIAAAAVTLLFIGLPGIVFAGLASVAVMIAMVVRDEVPPEITINAAMLTIKLAYFGLELVDFGTQVALAVAGKVLEPVVIADALGITFQSAAVSFAFSLVDLMTTEAINATGAVLVISNAILISFTVATVSFSFDLVDLMTLKAIELMADTITIADSFTINFTTAVISFGFDIVDLVTKKIISLLPTSIDLPMPDINFPNPFGGSGDPDYNGGGLGGGKPDGPLPAFAVPDFSAVTGGLEDAKQRVLDFTGVFATVGPAIQGAFGVSIDTSAFTGGLETAKAALVDLATTAQMQVLAMQMAGLQMGQAFGSGVSIGVTSSAGAVSAAMASYVAAANASRASMTAAGLGAGTGYGTGVAGGIRLYAGAVSSAIASYVAIASGYRGAMMAAGIGVGAALGQGIAAGIRSQVGNIAAAAAAAVTSAIAAAKAAGAISSPSRVMQDEVGRMLGLGVERGILDSLAGVSRAADQLVHVPAVPAYAGAPAGGGTSASVGHTYVTYEVTVNVEGNVTTEDNLLSTFTERFAQAIVGEAQRREIAYGGAS